ncbi:unnamed protein product [Cylicocyclus nassatus]|uniref:Uncharacterized protein n=1 Tax=Cylicocyclus nassatus TaxID=53992 RepID=A0AA36MAZ5_CYLNA|nr:unnamed protein product [Cylicocyclus nassatus]
MNALYICAIVVGLFATVSAKSIVPRSIGSNAYGDEPAIATAAPQYEGEAPVVEPVVLPAEEEPQTVENENPAAAAEAAVVESGYRSKREAGDNAYGDEPVPVVTPTYGAAALGTTFEPVPEEEPAALAMPAEPVIAEPIVEESGYRA